ncbi:hypothetical protein NLI96_g11469 [Meripilus lineatus]|uniref:Zinc finger PHD-type domain-containing protein n=1 Tax=Meripilus lineatus TaxID=2056292 RepID=A0AAD5URQ1_9APHY|nr:hypothetical protein NLI96_g11469 [Physisporinus lineatus]
MPRDGASLLLMDKDGLLSPAPERSGVDEPAQDTGDTQEKSNPPDSPAQLQPVPLSSPLEGDRVEVAPTVVRRRVRLILRDPSLNIDPQLLAESSTQQPGTGRLGSEPQGDDEPLYCWCRGPEKGNMIQCDCCDDWYHFTCVGVTERPKGSWYCSNRCKDDEKDGQKDGQKRRKVM